MEDRDKRKKILYIVLGAVVLILLFFMISSCSKNGNDADTNAITEIKLSASNLVLTVGDEETLSYTILPANSDETTRWLSSNNKVVSVDTRGNIKALQTGSAIITLVSEKGVEAHVSVKVVSKKTEDGEGVTAYLLEKDVNVKVGSTKKLSYELDPIDSKYIEVMWESSNNLVATVSSDGVVTGIKSGVATISVKIVLSDNTVVTDTATVTVEEQAKLYLTTNAPDVRVGEVVRLSAALSTSDVLMTEGTVKSSNDRVVSISNISTDSGYLVFDVKGLKDGKATLQLTVITSDGKTLNLDVPVTVVDFTDLYVSSGNKELQVGNSFVLSGRLEPSIEGSLETECKSSNEENVSVSNVSPSGNYNGACQITALKKGTSTITMNIAGQKQTIKVTVKEEAEENPNEPEDPNDPGNTDNPGNPTGEASLSVTLDKASYSINEKAVITVTFKDENGNTKTLSEGEYTVATEFDSTSLGTKKLVVVYPYGGSSLKAEVEYTIGGGTPGGDTPGVGETPGGDGGSSGGGGGGGGGNPGSRDPGVTLPTASVKTERCTGDDCTGTHKVTIKIQGDTELADLEQYLYGGFVIEYLDPNAPKIDAALLATPGSLSEKYDMSKIKIHGIGFPDENGRFHIPAGLNTSGGEIQVVVVGNKRETIENKYGSEINSELFLSTSNPKYSDVSNAMTGNGIPPSNSISNAITDYGSNSDTEYSEYGWVQIVPLTGKYKKNGDNVTFSVRARGFNDYKIVDIYSTDLGIDATYNSAQQASTNGSSDKNTVTAAVTFKNSNNGNRGTVTATTTVEIDSKLDGFECVSTTSNGLFSVRCTARDNKSGVDSITASVAAIRTAPLSDTDTEKVYRFTYDTAGVYTFTGKDKLGNTLSQTLTYGGNFCAAKAECNGNSCKTCQEAGCINSNDKMYYKYRCANILTNDESDYYIEAEITGGNLDSGLEISAPKESVRINTHVICTLVDEDVMCGQTDSLGVTLRLGDFNKNCKLCGCESSGWRKINGYENIQDASSAQGISNQDKITGFKIQGFTDSDCGGAKVGDAIISVGPGGEESDVENVLRD